MTTKKRVLLLGASLDNPNKGVNALCIGAMSLLTSNNPEVEIDIIEYTKGRAAEVQTVELAENQIVSVNCHYFSRTELVIASMKELLNTTRCFRFRPELSEIFRKSDSVFNINEGDSFSDIYGPVRFFRHFLDTLIPILLRKPITFLPQTIGPFNRALSRAMASWMLRRVTKLFVRDKTSQPFLQKMNIPFEESIDMATFMQPLTVKAFTYSNFVGININGLMYSNNYGSMQVFSGYPEIIIGLINHFAGRNIPVVLIPHTYNPRSPGPEDDLGAIKSAIKLGALHDVVYISDDFSAQQLKYIISKASFFIGSRMHSCIAALSSGVPTVGLSYSYKFKGTFRQFNLEEAVIEFGSKDPKDIINEIGSLFEQRSNLRERITRSHTFVKISA